MKKLDTALRKRQGQDTKLSSIIDNEMQNINTGFPLDVFPKAIQHLIHNAYETIGFPIDFFSAGILSACSTAIGNSVSLYNGSYTVKPILWVAIIGRAGTNKTHPLTFAKAPIEKRDSETFKEYKEKMKEYEQQEDKSDKPYYSKYILKDFTPEKIADTLQHNEKGILIFQDELMRWINSFDQYKKGGDQQMYLDLFNGGCVSVDRVTKEPIRIDATNVNILGGMHPQMLKGIAKNNRKEDGFLDRFLFVYPENLEPFLFTGLDIEDRKKENYKRLIFNLLDAPNQTIIADASNIEIYIRWQHVKAEDCFNDTLETSIQSKLETYVWRLALVIEMMQQAVNGSYTITLKDDSINKAIHLVEYFRINALRVHEKILSVNPLEDLTPIQLELYNELPTEFKRVEVLPLFEAKGFKRGAVARFLGKKELFTRIDGKGHYKKKNIINI